MKAIALGLAVLLASASIGSAAPPRPVQTLEGAQANIDAGLASYRRLRFQEAEQYFQAAADADPTNAAAAFYLAYTVYKIAEPKHPFHPEKQRAARLFAQAYALDPNFTPAWAPKR